MQLAPSSELQKRFLNVDATIIVYGGSVGAGKTYNGILRHLRFCTDPHYVGYVIRKYEKVLRDGGGAFNEAVEMCRAFCPRIKVTTKPMKIMFPWGACLYFGGYEDDKAGDKYRGLQISAAMVDEGTQLKESHIWMLISRLRSNAKVDGHIWITCNPDPDSYLAKWVDWYLYPKGHKLAGRPDPKKNGKIRWFVRYAGVVVWADSEQELRDVIRHKYKSKDPISPLTFVFLGGTIEDNPLLIKNNPSYKAALDGLPRVQKERDYHGNWYVRAEEAGYFKREWLGTPIKFPPTDIVNRVRAWDLAGSLKSETNSDPDWTVGVLMSKMTSGKYCIEDVVRFRARHGEVLDMIIETANQDGDDVTVVIPRDAGQAGLVASAYQVGKLSEAGFKAKVKQASKSKLKRFEPVAASMEVFNFCCVEGVWNEEYFMELEAFDGVSRNKHDDW